MFTLDEGTTGMNLPSVSRYFHRTSRWGRYVCISPGVRSQTNGLLALLQQDSGVAGVGRHVFPDFSCSRTPDLQSPEWSSERVASRSWRQCLSSMVNGKKPEEKGKKTPAIGMRESSLHCSFPTSSLNGRISVDSHSCPILVGTRCHLAVSSATAERAHLHPTLLHSCGLVFAWLFYQLK